MMGVYCVQNPEIFIGRNFTKVKTTNAKEYYANKAKKKNQEELGSITTRHKILSYA